jgi:hypothetical protein
VPVVGSAASSDENLVAATDHCVLPNGVATVHGGWTRRCRRHSRHAAVEGGAGLERIHVGLGDDHCDATVLAEIAPAHLTSRHRMLRVRAICWILPKSADLCVSQFKEHQKDSQV